MKRLLRTILMELVTLTSLTAWYKRRALSRGPVVRVVCLHDVTNADWLRGFLTILAEQYHVLTPEDFKARRWADDKINVLLTFDDGYQSWVEVALPLLAEFNMQAVFFISSGLLDAHDTEAVNKYVAKRLRLQPKQTLTWEGARALVAAGHQIGGHTVGHRDLTTLGKDELPGEITNDQARLKQQLGVDPRWFAYPFGAPEHYNADVIAAAASQYEAAFVAHGGFAREINHTVPRLCLPRDQALGTVPQWLDGGYDLFKMVF